MLRRIDPQLTDLFAPQLSVWHNYDATRVSLSGALYASALLHKLQGAQRCVSGYADSVAHLHVSDGAFTLAATATGTYPDGGRLYIARCLVVTVEGGRITHIDSYGDCAQSEPLDKLVPLDALLTSGTAAEAALQSKGAQALAGSSLCQ